MFESDSLRRREDSDFFLGNGSSYCSLVRIVRYTSQASCLVRGLSWSERFFEIPLCQGAHLNPMINWITLELMVVTRSFNVVYTFGSKRSCSSPGMLAPVTCRGNSTSFISQFVWRWRFDLVRFVPGPDVSDRLLFRQESVDFSGSDGFGGIFVCVSLMHSTMFQQTYLLPGDAACWWSRKRVLWLGVFICEYFLLAVSSHLFQTCAPAKRLL